MYLFSKLAAFCTLDFSLNNEALRLCLDAIKRTEHKRVNKVDLRNGIKIPFYCFGYFMIEKSNFIFHSNWRIKKMMKKDEI